MINVLFYFVSCIPPLLVLIGGSLHTHKHVKAGDRWYKFLPSSLILFGGVLMLLANIGLVTIVIHQYQLATSVSDIRRSAPP